MKRKYSAILTLATLFVAQSAAAEQLVREFTGSENTTTAEFTVEAPWVLDWWLIGAYSTQLVALEVWLVDAKTGRNLGQVLFRKQHDEGLKLFDTGGTYRLRISGTLAKWRMRIVQLTPEEAEAYTPRERAGPPRLKP